MSDKSPKVVKASKYTNEISQSVIEVLEECLERQRVAENNVLEIVVMTRYKDGSMDLNHSSNRRADVNMMIDDAKLINLDFYNDKLDS